MKEVCEADGFESVGIPDYPEDPDSELEVLCQSSSDPEKYPHGPGYRNYRYGFWKKGTDPSDIQWNSGYRNPADVVVMCSPHFYETSMM